MKFQEHLYFAYGSNLCVEQFFRRCPAAKSFGRLTLPDWRLVFDRVADVEPHRGARVEGALYEITAACERALDSYEGFPGLYVKDYFEIQYKTRGGKTIIRPVMLYTMMTESVRPPSPYYLGIIRRGFDDWNIPHDTLDAAHRRSLGKGDWPAPGERTVDPRHHA
jgi:gamma-glutamylcyclotransferase (GGCT)/AIG2-like uncharacterized protein YtfP